MADTRTRLVRCFAAVFPELTEDQIQRATAESVPNWDSLASATLFTVIEEEFQVDIAPEDTGQLASFDRALAYLDAAAVQS